MLTGAHVVIYSRDAESDRAFFRENLGLCSVDAGHGWLIFALPRTEAAFHPSDSNNVHELYLMCDDLQSEMALKTKNIVCSEIEETQWGSVTTIRLPGGGHIGLYQPKHPTASALTT